MNPDPPLDPIESLIPEWPGLPAPSDKLFQSQEDWWNNACLNWGAHGWTLYASGYKEAADLLVKHIEARGASQDTLVYPILFLYRQYLELLIKDTLRMARRLRDVDGEMPMHHRIDALWHELHRLLRQISPGDSEPELQEVGRLIGEFSRADPLSMAFRYPVDTKGNATLPGITHINLRNVRDVLGKISIMMEGANSQVHEYLQYKLEMEREFRDDMGGGMY
ncbi:MAG: hypothetical protein EOP24_42080 [Hyphomicrobiales bacterium]|nr:MAG: hypothetical protein EOP24_42080 [Hyphomicrobiales bacterium]